MEQLFMPQAVDTSGRPPCSCGKRHGLSKDPSNQGHIKGYVYSCYN